MGNYNRDDRSGDRRSSGRNDFGRRSFGGNRGPVEMHQAVCSNCGKSCEVPFRPNGSKPVYCNDCFKRVNSESGTGRFPERSPNRPDFEKRNEARPQESEQLNTINRKLDKILAILAPPPVKTEVVTKPEVLIAATPIKKISKKAPVVKE